jgi:multidrug efflux system outer membrane protein
MKPNMRKQNPWILGILLSLTVSGCAVGPDFQEPVVQTPDTYRTAVMPAEPAEDLKWWSLFDDPLLFDLVTEALHNNRDIQIAVSRIEQARATLGFTRADQYPGIDVDAGVQTGNFNGFHAHRTRHPRFTWPLH